MRKVVGYVKVLETDEGIPNLVVAAYDAPDAPSQVSGRAMLDQVGAGRPIASVLTKTDGWFEFDEHLLGFQGNEARPNLAIVVLAPEDVRDPHLPVPPSTQRRILYLSYSSRRDAGAHEAYNIRLARETLDSLRIPYGVNHSIASTWRNRNAQRAVLKPLYLEEHERTKKFKEVARKKVRRLVAGPRRLMGGDIRNSDFLILHKNDLGRRLPGLQSRTVKEGVQRLAKRDPKLRLQLSDDDLKDLGLTNQNGQWTGNISADKLIAKTRDFMTGEGLVRSGGAENKLTLEELDRRYPAPPTVVVQRRTRGSSTSSGRAGPRATVQTPSAQATTLAAAPKPARPRKGGSKKPRAERKGS